jgi:hypothetical protein
MSNEEILIHCPECPVQSFFGIKNRGDNECLEYKCRYGHQGEKSILDFGENELKNYSKIPCKYCKKINFQMNYCFECKDNICDENNCLLEHSKLQHNKIVNLNDINNLCLLHLKPFEYFCQNCKILLCSNCPNFHIEHNIISTFTFENEKFDDIETKFKEIESSFDNIIINDLGQFVEKVKKVYDSLKNRCLKELKFIDSLIKTSKFQNNKLNFEIIDCLKNLKFNDFGTIQNAGSKTKYLIKNKNFKILVEFDIFQNNQLFIGEKNFK